MMNDEVEGDVVDNNDDSDDEEDEVHDGENN